MAESDANETAAVTAPGQTTAGSRPGQPSSPGGTGKNQAESHQEGLEFILDIPLQITVELGRTSMLIHDLLKLGQGSVIELHKATGETLEIMANQKLIARGEVVSVNDNYGIRLTEIVSPMERIKKLK
jgi:flagellar motor switch protein FliN/FliY